MNRFAKMCKVLTVTVFVAFVLAGSAGQAFGDTKPKFIYVVNSGSLQAGGTPQATGVSAYSINGTTGGLSLVPGSPFAAGSNPYSVTVDPSNRFVYVTNRLSNNVSAFVIDGTTGALTAVPGSPFSTGLNPYSVAVDPSAKFVYVANEGSNNVSAFTVNNQTGALTPASGSPFPAHTGPVSVTIDPLGKFVYVTNGGTGTPLPSFDISAYAIDGSSGALIPVPGSPFAAAFGPIAGVVDPSGKFLFEVAAFGSHWSVNSFTINSATGALTPVGGCHAPCGDSWPSAVAMDPSGKFLYATDNISDYVAARTIDSTTGQLGLLAGSPTGDFGHSAQDPVIGPYATGVLPNAIAVDPSGAFAYVANEFSNSISAYTIDGATGALSPIPGSPFATGAGPSSLAISASSNVPFESFKVKVDIDEDRKTSFRVGGFFTLGVGNNGIHPLTENVTLHVGTFTATIPAGSFRERGRHEFEFNGWVNDADLRITIYEYRGKDFLFTAEGRGNILEGIKNPVSVGLAIGDDEGGSTVKADIDR